MATDPELGNGEISLRGSFNAAPSELPASFSATIRGFLDEGALRRSMSSKEQARRDAWREVLTLLASVMQRSARRSSHRYQIVEETTTRQA